MQISLRSHMIAGTTALVGATAIAMTPVAPAVSLPSLNTAKAAVELAALDNPITAVIKTGGLAIDYLINGQYVLGAGGGAANWGSGMNTNSGIGDLINATIYNSFAGGRYLPNIKNVGIVPNFLSAPFPIGLQVVNNWLGYAGVIVDTASTVLGDLSSLIWAPVGITVAIAQAILTGQISTIPAILQAGVQAAITGITNAIQTTVLGAQYILSSIVTKAQAVVTNLSSALPNLTSVIQGQVAALSASVTTNVGAITAAIAGGDPTTIWNTVVNSLLSPTGIPGTVLNLTLGAGVQLNPADPLTYVPSVRATVQTLQQSVKGALGTAPASAAVARPAAAKAAAAASGSSAPKPAAAKVGRHAVR